MNVLFTQLMVADFHQVVARNIVSLQQTQDLYDDLSFDPADWSIAQKTEAEVKPPPYRSATPILSRPFEDAEWFNAINWLFKNWQASRFSDGTYGVWYGSESIETTVFESVHHWFNGLIRDAGFEHETVVAERTVYMVTCHAALLDFRAAAVKNPDLLHRSDYSLCQSVGARIHREGHPGLLSQSVRRVGGTNVVIFNPDVLSKPQKNGQLTYRLEGNQVLVQKSVGETWLSLDLDKF